MSNGNVIGWTIFLLLIYFRLITVRLVTEIRGGEKLVIGSATGRCTRAPLAQKIAGVQSVHAARSTRHRSR